MTTRTAKARKALKFQRFRGIAQSAGQRRKPQEKQQQILQRRSRGGIQGPRSSEGGASEGRTNEGGAAEVVAGVLIWSAFWAGATITILMSL